LKNKDDNSEFHRISQLVSDSSYELHHSTAICLTILSCSQVAALLEAIKNLLEVTNPDGWSRWLDPSEIHIFVLRFSALGHEKMD
jgi:hypothetical protein